VTRVVDDPEGAADAAGPRAERLTRLFRILDSLLQVHAMPSIRIFGTLCFGLSAAALSSGTHAADLLGLYVGAAGGQATIRAEQLHWVNAAGNPIGGADSISKNDTGWKTMLGVRPISLLGAELEYIDFGHASQTTTIGLEEDRADLRARALSFFGVFYAPIPVPAFDLYAKVGMSSLHSTVNEVGRARIDCFPTLCPWYVHRDGTESRIAYGAGLQVKLARFAIRAEYEKIRASTGDPSLMSLGLIWRFY
jgi:hypothetical protein